MGRLHVPSEDMGKTHLEGAGQGGGSSVVLFPAEPSDLALNLALCSSYHAALKNWVVHFDLDSFRVITRFQAQEEVLHGESDSQVSYDEVFDLSRDFEDTIHSC